MLNTEHRSQINGPLQRHIGDSLTPAANAAIAIESQQAVVIGIGTYESGFDMLDNATADAASVAEVLASEYGFTLLPQDAETPLLDSRATVDAIKPVVKESLRQAGPSTRWLFYFAGHGTVVDDVGYLLPAGAVRGDPSTYLPLSWLLDRCRESECAEILVVLDACYSGRALVRSETLDTLAPSDDDLRVRQVIASGNPRQPVLDGGGSGHSIFTQALLDGLQGWSGIHEESGGQVWFARLLDQVAYEVPVRLRERGQSAIAQQPIGGNFVSNSAGRQFLFEPVVPRLPPEIVRDMRSEDAGHRALGLIRLVDTAAPEPPAQALELAVRHLQSGECAGGFWARRDRPLPLIGHTLRYEPSAEVRAQAATTLGELTDPGSDDPLAVDALIAALGDVPGVCRAAAQVLGRLAVPRAAAPLLERLQASDGTLFLDLVAAIGAVGDPATTLEALGESVRRGRLVPFVGPDFPVARTGGLPDRRALARELAERERLQASDSLADTAALTMQGDNRLAFASFLKHKMGDQLRQPGEIHRALAGLPVPLWISGAYDGLLAKALHAQSIVSGIDTRYLVPEHPRVVRLLGALTDPDLVVLKSDYERLREDEENRQLLVSYLRNELRGKVLLLLGHDPESSDFALLVEHILNGHLAGLDGRAFLVWPASGPDHRWDGRLIQPIGDEPLTFVGQLVNALSLPERQVPAQE